MSQILCITVVKESTGDIYILRITTNWEENLLYYGII